MQNLLKVNSVETALREGKENIVREVIVIGMIAVIVIALRRVFLQKQITLIFNTILYHVTQNKTNSIQ